MRDLGSIKSFGNIDANSDELLFKCFEKHEGYKDIIEFKKNMVVGKKGAGKTAIYKMILNNSASDVFSKGYNLRDYPWHLHLKQASEVFNKQEKFVNSWIYLCLIELSKIICNEDNSFFYEDKCYESKSIIEKFLMDTYGNVNPKINNIFRPREEFKFSSLLKTSFMGQGIEFKLPFDKISVSDFPIVVNEVNETIKYHIFNLLNPDNRYYLCFDELDFGFKKNDDYYDMIIGLIRASNELNREAKSLGLKLNICIFLREDIFSLLRYEDKRKTIQNCVTTLEWDADTSEYTLKGLMEKRFTEVLKSEDTDIVKWDDIFDNKTIDGKKKQYDYILRMTCNRPRDMIDFCNQIIKAYHSRIKIDNDNLNVFVNKDIVKAKEQYSKNLKSEFQDEIFKHLDNFDEYLEILNAFGKGKFDISELEKFVEKNGYNVNTVKMLKELYEFSVVGNYKIGGTKGGSENLFKYKNSEAKFRNDLEVVVHPGLRTTLGLTEK